MAVVRILAALLAAVSLNCAAAPYAVRIGAERIVLDSPPGFSDTTELASPRLQELAETLTSASNRILLFALTDADVRRFMSGDPLEAKRYLIAVTPKGLERERVTAAQFAAFVSDSLRGLGKPPGTVDYLKYLDQQPHGKASLLTELRKDSTVVSVLQGTRLPPAPGGGFWSGDKPPQYLLSTTTIFLVRGRALQLSAYASFDSAADVEWLQTITLRWMDELLRLNSR